MADVFEILKNALGKVDSLRQKLDSAIKVKDEVSGEYDSAVEVAKKAHADVHEHVSASVPGVATQKARVI